MSYSRIYRVSLGFYLQLECESRGSRPEPVITWWMGDRFLGKHCYYTPLYNIHNTYIQYMISQIFYSDFVYNFEKLFYWVPVNNTVIL